MLKPLFLVLTAISSLLLLGSLSLFSNEESRGRIRFETLSTDTQVQLSSNHVAGITEDLLGYLWIATSRGIDRFDGWEIRPYQGNNATAGGLPTSSFTAIATRGSELDPLWIGTASNGLIAYSSAGRSISRFSASSPSAHRLPSSRITALTLVDGNRLWVGTSLGLVCVRTDSMTVEEVRGELGDCAIRSISTNDDGRLWVGSETGKLFVWEPKEETFSIATELSVPVTSVVRDPRNTLWIGTDGLGLFSQHSSESEPKRHSSNHFQSVSDMLVDSNGDLWVGTQNGLGLYEFSRDDFRVYRSARRLADSLADDEITSLHEDNFGTLWIGTESGGLSRFSLDRNWFQHIRASPDPGFRIKDSRVLHLETTATGEVLLVTPTKLAQWETGEKNFTPLEVGIPSGHSLTSFTQTEEGHIWIATRGSGLMRWQPESEVLDTFRFDPDSEGTIPHDNIAVVHSTSTGQLLIGTHGNGLARRLDGDKFRLIRDLADSSARYIKAIDSDPDGDSWLITDGGLRFLPDGADQLALPNEVFAEVDFPTGGVLSSLLAEGDGLLWLGTESHGLVRINLQTGDRKDYDR
ncbi:MAG: two-component regulator propeller domain-containing protein, partial [Verrucomicrobiota bacterium]